MMEQDTGTEGIEVDRAQMQAGIGEGALDMQEGAAAKASEDASAADMTANSGQEEKVSPSDQIMASVAKFQQSLKAMAQTYRVTCLNCGAQLHVELPHASGSFQCCQCHAVHKVIQDNFAISDQNKKRKRKDKPSNGKADDKEPRELSIYNKFIKEHLAALKNENPGMAHKDAYKQVSAMWATSLLNPKRVAAVDAPSEMGADAGGMSHVGAPAQQVDQAAFHYAHPGHIAEHRSDGQEKPMEAAKGTEMGTDRSVGGPENPPMQP